VSNRGGVPADVQARADQFRTVVAGKRMLLLDMLSDAESRELLGTRLGADRVASQAGDRLTALCGGLPLALIIVASHAQARPDLPLSALADELAGLGPAELDNDDPQASLPSVLSWSYRALAPDQGHRVRVARPLARSGHRRPGRRGTHRAAAQ
jgi:hypothetical protein